MDFIPLDVTVPQEEDPLDVMLNFVGFANSQANMIREDGFGTIECMRIDILEDQDIKYLSTTFRWLPALIQIIFGMDRTKQLIGMIHLIQNHELLTLTASITIGTTQINKREAWSKALERANSRASFAKKAKAAQAGSDPDKLKSDKGLHD